MTGRRGDERGVVLPLVAIFLVVIVGAAALGIDLSNVVRVNSELQKLADIGAMDSARVLDGSSTAVIFPAVCTAAMNAVQGRNGFTVPAGQGCNGPALTVVLGTWDPVANTFTPSGGTQAPNAVQATVTLNIPYFFSAGSQTDSRSAIANSTPSADIEASSYGAAVGSTLFCSLLAPAIPPGPLSAASGPCITLVGPGGIATFSITFGNLLGTPTAVSLGILTPNQLLTASLSSVIQMTADLFPTGSPSQVALQGLAAAVGPLTASATLGSLVASGSTGTSTSGASSSIQVGTLVYGALQLANGQSGINVSGLSLDAGLVTASVTSQAVQGPVIVQHALVGTTTPPTSQITATVAITATGLPAPVTLTFTGASAMATLVSIACNNPLSVATDTLTGTESALTVSGSVLPSPISLTIASPDPQTFVFYPDDPTNHGGANPNPATMTTSVPDTGLAIVTALGPGLPPTVPAADVAALLDGVLSGLGFQVTGAQIGSPQGGLVCGSSTLVQ